METHCLVLLFCHCCVVGVVSGAGESGKTCFGNFRGRDLPYPGPGTPRPRRLPLSGWANDTQQPSLTPALTPIGNDWDLSCRACLHQNCDHSLETCRPAQPHLPCCGILERHARFCISVGLIRSSRERLLCFGLHTEEGSPTEGRYPLLSSPPVPNLRNAGSP